MLFEETQKDTGGQAQRLFDERIESDTAGTPVKPLLPPPGTEFRASGVISREIYRSPDFAVASLQRDDPESEITIVGNFPQLRDGERITIVGKVVNNPKFGRQIRVEKCIYEMPVNAVGIERFLGSGLIKGLGPALAARVVAKFGDQTLDVIDQDPKQLIRVSGIGASKLRDIQASWQEHKSSREVIAVLQEHDISISLAVKVCKEYGSEAGRVIRQDPYRLAAEITGIGFKKADSLAHAFGFIDADPRRIKAGLIYTLNEALSDGHVFLSLEDLTAEASDLLAVDPALVTWQIQILSHDRDDHLVVDTIADQQVCYLKPFFTAERNAAASIRKLLEAEDSRLAGEDLNNLELDPRLSPEQSQAVITALTTPISVITGGPGCGKSFLVFALVSALEKMNKSFALAAPTGRAAKRLGESTGKLAMTIHRLLGITGEKGWVPPELDVDMVIVDEMSMVDLILFYRLLQSLQPGMHLVLVGDADQLPSVGAGNVLLDMIQSGIAPVTRLTRIFRQAEGSHIITNAHRINHGEQPLFDPHSTDFFFFGKAKEGVASTVLDLVAAKIPAKFGLTPAQVQVLSPMQKGDNGVKNLNQLLRDKLNPSGPGKPTNGLFRLGDKVMQIKNNYDKGVFNGDMGYIVKLDAADEENPVEIEFDNLGRVSYQLDELNEQVILAYAVTIHKSQGGEFPCVVIVLSNEHYVMLQRNLLYTAITRAKQVCILVGSRSAIAMAVNNNQVKRRCSGLAWRLKEGGEG